MIDFELQDLTAELESLRTELVKSNGKCEVMHLYRPSHEYLNLM